MTKVKTLDEIAELVKKYKKEGKTVGLVTGCFDVVHLGHLRLLKFGKESCDILIVGLDNDDTIRINKSSGRPIHSLEKRLEFLEHLSYVDLLYSVKGTFDYSTEYANGIQKTIARKISPDYLITLKSKDDYWKDKESRAIALGIKLLLLTNEMNDSTTQIVQKIEQDL